MRLGEADREFVVFTLACAGVVALVVFLFNCFPLTELPNILRWLLGAGACVLGAGVVDRCMERRP